MKPIDYYKIDRDQFIEIFDKIFPCQSKQFDLLENSMFEPFNGELFYIFYVDEEITILNKKTYQVLNWYKFYHIGRALQSSGLETKQDFENFLTDLRTDLDLCSYGLNKAFLDDLFKESNK